MSMRDVVMSSASRKCNDDSCWFDGNGALGYQEHHCSSGSNWAKVGISIG